MQCIKESSTLRMSPEKKKPSPRIVTRIGTEDNEIKNYLKWRKNLKPIDKYQPFDPF